MIARFPLAGAVVGCTLLAACATPQGYPSLSIARHGRVSGTMQPVRSAPFTPTPPSHATLAQVDDLITQARKANAAFLAATPAARSAAIAAEGAEVGSDSWSSAQVAIANLETMRANAMIALADLDKLYVDAAINGGTIKRLGDARAEIAALVASENATVAALLQHVGPSAEKGSANATEADQKKGAGPG